MNSLQPAQNLEADNEGSNAFSSTSFIPEFVHRQSVKKPSSGPAVTLEQKLSKLKYELFTSISVLTPSRLKPLQLRKQLCNYQFERIQRKMESQTLTKFGKAEQQLFREQQNLILILSSVMKEFKSSPNKYFYMVTKKNSRVFFFHHNLDQKGQYMGSTLTICNLADKMAGQLSSLKIPYQKIDEQNCQKLIIKNQGINIYWSTMVNKIIQNEKHYKGFYILTNYPFPGSTEMLPIQLFNGPENKKQYSYIAQKKTNLIGETIEEVYRMKIAGLWTVDNLKAVGRYLEDAFGGKGFELEFQVDRVTQFIRNQGKDEDE